MAMSGQPKVAAVLCTILGDRHLSARASRASQVAETVASILTNSYRPLEVIVVDQSPNDAIAEALRPFMQDRRLRYITTTQPGLTRAQNIAVQVGNAQIFAFTDDDCIVPPDWIDRIVAAFKRHPEAGMVFGSVLPPEGHDWNTSYVPRLEWDSEARLRPTFLPRVHSLMGANMAVRRETFERIGLFEEAFSPHPINGEVDLAFRASRARPPIPIYVTPTVSVVHQYGGRPMGAPTRNLLNTYHMGSTILATTHALRGDVGAACKLALMGFEPLADAVRGIASAGKPRGLSKVVPYGRGVASGVRGVLRLGAGRPPRLAQAPDAGLKGESR